MENRELRLECIKLSLEVIKRTGEYIEPFKRAEDFYQFIIAKDEVPKDTPVQKAPTKTSTGQAKSPRKYTKK